jgi:chitinase
MADAGADQSAQLGAAVTLDGSNSSDADGAIVSFLWEQTAGTAVALSGASTQTATFTAPNAAATLSFRLTVTDNDGLSDTNTVNVTVGSGTQPVASGGGGGGGGCFIGSMF